MNVPALDMNLYANWVAYAYHEFIAPQVARWARPRHLRPQYDVDVHCALENVAPFALTYVITPRPSHPDLLRIIEASGPAFANHIAVNSHIPLVGSVRITRDRRSRILMEVPNPQPWTPTIETLVKHNRPARMEWCVGIDQASNPILVNPRLNGGWTFIGPQQRGKTTGAAGILGAQILTQSPADFQFLLLAPKRHKWDTFIRTPHCLGIASTPDEYHEAVNWVLLRMDERNKEGESARVPAIVMLVDDGHRVFANTPKLGKMAAAVWSTGGEYHIFAWMTTQKLGSKDVVGDMMIESNAQTRFQYTAVDATDASKAGGASGSESHLLSGAPGDCLFTAGGLRGVRIATCQEIPPGRLPQVEEAAPVWDIPRPAMTGARPIRAPHLSFVRDAPPTEVTPTGNLPSAPVTPDHVDGFGTDLDQLLEGMTVEQQTIARLLVKGHSPHRIAVEMCGHSGGQTYQSRNKAAKGIRKVLEDAGHLAREGA